MVFQDFKLFAFPVWQNITAGGERQDDRVLTALRQADAQELIRQLPQGLDTYLYQDLEEGVTVSGGEAQKLALARALYKDAPVVILDEPTASLQLAQLPQTLIKWDFFKNIKTTKQLYNHA